MALVVTHLADKSALARLSHDVVAARLEPLIARGMVGTCALIDLEMLFSTRSPDDYERVRGDRRAGYEWLPMESGVWDRALDVQRRLAARSMTRAVGIRDLLVAATAEVAGVTLLHYDADFEHVAAITGQPVEWVVPRGTVP